MDKWRYELAQIKKEFESGAFKQRAKERDGSDITPPKCLSNDFCDTAPQGNSNGILTMAFVNMQPIDSVYSVTDALKKGTLFPNIDKPFEEGRRI